MKMEKSFNFKINESFCLNFILLIMTISVLIRYILYILARRNFKKL
jgi:hypothetical protein